MSLLLGQRKSSESVRPRSERISPSTATQVAGVPLLMKLPDLRAKKSDTAEAKLPTEEMAKPDAPAGVPDAVASETPDRDGKTRDYEHPGSEATTDQPSVARFSAWRSSLWHLLIPIGLLVLFLAAWVIISSPADETLDDAAATDIEAPDIDMGELVTPQDLALEEFEPVSGPDASTEEQVSGASPSQAPDSSGDNAVEDTIPGSMMEAPADLSSAPPLLEREEDPVGFIPEQPSQQSYEFAADPRATAPPPSTPPAMQQGFSYPTTDPTTYGYSGEAGSTPSMRQPSTNPYSYPTTGAPPLNANSGAASGVQQR